ncbi:hypothetical protein BDW22DRAFT_141097 [Trametopsis cervina]|nr:hypothetical protein BDW22DRAFT_141097 [Trametopsis cervina]
MALMTTAPDSDSGDSRISSPASSPDMDPSESSSAHDTPSTTTTTNQDHQLPDPSQQHQPRHLSPLRNTSPSDALRARSAGRGGCWTCRVRRKKCDEEHVDGDSCKTCRRLGIKCLGWGPRRPDWMRDKEKVAQYKADIKAQLTRAGLIRGQPRAVYTSLSTPSPSSLASRVLIAPSDRYPQPAAAGPGPSTSLTFRSRRSEAASAASSSSSFHPYPPPPPPPPHPPSAQYPRPPVISGIPGLDTLNASPDLSLPPFAIASGHAGYGAQHHQQPVYASAAVQHQQHIPHMSPYPSPGAMFEVAPQPSVSPITMQQRMSPLNEPTEPLIAYYFEHVRKLQFAFAGQELTTVLYRILQRDPHGPLEHAICALSGLHSSKMQMNGLDVLDGGTAASAHKRYFDEGHILLLNNRAAVPPRQFPEDDALGAVFLIGYYMMVGGGRNWLQLLEIAYDWFAQTGIHEEQNPKLMLLNMTDVQRIAIKAVMWIDVLTSIIFTNSPRYLSVYRRLLGAGGGGFWASTGDERMDLRMDRLTGCPDEAVLALAETAHLANWKRTGLQKGSLSTRELVRLGDQIEQALRQQPFRSYTSSPSNETGPVLPNGMPAAGGASGLYPGYDLSPTDDAARRAIPQIWRETAVLYLHTILSDSHPGVPEVVKAVSTLMDWYNSFGASDLDRSILFPLLLTSFLTDNALFYDLVKQRLTLHAADHIFNGPMAQGAHLVEYVWQRRVNRQLGMPVDWRECIRERWSSLVML